MNPAVVVVGEEDRGHVLMVFDLLRKSISQAGVPADSHANSQIRPLDVAGADVIAMWRSADCPLLNPDALCGTIAGRAWDRGAVDFDEHGIVDVRAESVVDCVQVSPCPSVVSCTRLDSRPATSFINSAAYPPSRAPDHPRHHKFRVGINRGPGPHIAETQHALQFGLHILLFALAESPYLIALDSAGRKVSHFAIVECLARLAKIGQQFEDRGLADARHADGAVDAVALDQSRNYLHPLGCA